MKTPARLTQHGNFKRGLKPCCWAWCRACAGLSGSFFSLDLFEPWPSGPKKINRRNQIGFIYCVHNRVDARRSRPPALRSTARARSLPARSAETPTTHARDVPPAASAETTYACMVLVPRTYSARERHASDMWQRVLDARYVN